VEELAKDIISRPKIEGITISGGEPMEQAGLLANLLELVLAKRPELNVISYTGYQVEQLISNDALRFISHLDVLIDGQYIHERNDNIGLRGSSNQRVLFLTNRLAENAKMFTEERRRIEIRLKGQSVTLIGLTNKKATEEGLPL
jgi:anaerobic ribonucleoside-triphosphate reductase activating protein